MRYVLPKGDYRKIKDRKSARVIRRERTNQIKKLQRRNSKLQRENDRLKQMLDART